MDTEQTYSPMTESLEDYLETIYHLVCEKKVARVKDIAKDRAVSMASVSTAMHRLDELGLIVYNQREFIELTPKGEQEVRRIITRHEILRRFFSEFLQVSPDVADHDACGIEHHLSDETVDRFVRLLEFLENCPEGKEALGMFKSCHQINPEMPRCEEPCDRRERAIAHAAEIGAISLGQLSPGQRGAVTQIKARGSVRQRLIDMGMLPNTEVTVERVAPSGDPIWIKIRGFNLSLRKEEAQGIVVAPL